MVKRNRHTPNRHERRSRKPVTREQAIETMTMFNACQSVLNRELHRGLAWSSSLFDSNDISVANWVPVYPSPTMSRGAPEHHVVAYSAWREEWKAEIHKHMPTRRQMRAARSILKIGGVG